MKQVLFRLFSDIRFWIVLFFLVRLITINQPLIDTNDWRQADGYSIARNFLEIDANILYPRIDHAGNLSGITGSEFPLMNYLVYLLYLVFGVDWWQGRLVNLLFSSLGVWSFYKIALHYTTEKSALFASLILIVSVWLPHSRKFMPDIFSTSLFLSGIYFGIAYLKESHGKMSLLYFFTFCLLGLLCKPPAMITSAFVLPFLIDPHINRDRKIKLFLFSILAAIPSFVWYFKWVPFLNEEYGYRYFFMGSDLLSNLKIILKNPLTIINHLFMSVHFLTFSLFVVGLFLVIRSKNRMKKQLTLFSFILFIAFLTLSANKFVLLSYYAIPFIPFMALIAASALSAINLSWLKPALVFLILIEGIANQLHDFYNGAGYVYRLDVYELAKSHSNKEDLVAFNSDLNPAPLYISHRKGWSFYSSDSTNYSMYKEMKDKGCMLIIWDKNKSNAPKKLSPFKKLKETNDFVLYK